MREFKVLIVDDEYLIRNLIRMRIDWAANGMVIVGEAGCAEEAFALVESLKPDMIFTDICMPKMDGIEFASRVMTLHPEIRIAVITGHDDFRFAQRSVRAGIIDYLLKPILADELLAASARMRSSIEREQSLVGRLSVSAAQSRALHPLVSRVLAYMNEHLDDETLNINDVAGKFFVSRGHLGRLLKQETGKTFVEQITFLRIKEAQRLLASTDLPAYEIGERVGVKDPHYFSVLFKKWAGIPLGKYRKNAKG